MATFARHPVVSFPSCPPKCAIDPRVETLLQTIQTHPSHDVSRLAEIVGLSVSRISHLFKRETGYDLRSFITQCRLEKATRLLQNPATPIKEISFVVGYRHTASFTRAFRKQFGCTPQQYRSR